MWILTVTRKYESAVTGIDREDKVIFKAKNLEELQIIIEKFAEFGTDGTYVYEITKEEGEEEC